GGDRREGERGDRDRGGALAARLEDGRERRREKAQHHEVQRGHRVHAEDEGEADHHHGKQDAGGVLLVAPVHRIESRNRVARKARIEPAPDATGTLSRPRRHASRRMRSASRSMAQISDSIRSQPDLASSKPRLSASFRPSMASALYKALMFPSGTAASM